MLDISMSATDETITLTRSRALGGPALDVVVPRRLGAVRLMEEVGRGGTGVVYKGRDDVLNRVVAVKFLSGAVPDEADPGFAEFLEGARAAAAVNRSGLVTIYSAGIVEGLPYVVMQYVDGPTVSQLLRHEPFAADDALAVALEAVELTAALHDHGIIHRDIKPSNLLIDFDGHLFLTDFGLAHRRRSVEDARPLSWAGTPAYMAPEMFEGQVSPRSDVYALGVTAFELLSGRPPFRGTVEELRGLHQAGAMPFDALPAKLPGRKALVDVLERATHQKSMFRYKSASQFARALRGACPQIATAGKVEVSLMQRVNRLRSAAATAASKTAATSASPEPQTPRSSSSLHDHISELISLRRSLREGGSDAQATAAAQPVAMEEQPAPAPRPKLTRKVLAIYAIVIAAAILLTWLALLIAHGKP
jgi:serine/threonine-protein kinase